MKLVELLALELKAWPDGAEFYCQDYNRNAYPYEVKPERREHSDVLWGCKGQLSGFSAAVLSDIASDHATAIVTRSDWAAERARIAKPSKKADKDGWIRHRGGKCPVKAGVMVDYRMRNGSIDGFGRKSETLDWEHYSEIGDIMAYKLHIPAEQVESCSKPELQINLPDGYGEIYNAQAVEHGPIQWRDRITEIDATAKALTTERAELVQKLASEGFALIGRINDLLSGAAQKHEDMGDPKNWMEGDLIESVSDDRVDISIGVKYQLVDDCNGRLVRFRDDDGDIRDRPADLYKFHSRPSA